MEWVTTVLTNVYRPLHPPRPVSGAALEGFSAPLGRPDHLHGGLADAVGGDQLAHLRPHSLGACARSHRARARWPDHPLLPDRRRAGRCRRPPPGAAGDPERADARGRDSRVADLAPPHLGPSHLRAVYGRRGGRRFRRPGAAIADPEPGAARAPDERPQPELDWDADREDLRSADCRRAHRLGGTRADRLDRVGADLLDERALLPGGPGSAAAAPDERPGSPSAGPGRS